MEALHGCPARFFTRTSFACLWIICSLSRGSSGWSSPRPTSYVVVREWLASEHEKPTEENLVSARGFVVVVPFSFAGCDVLRGSRQHPFLSVCLFLCASSLCFHVLQTLVVILFCRLRLAISCRRSRRPSRDLLRQALQAIVALRHDKSTADALKRIAEFIIPRSVRLCLRASSRQALRHLRFSPGRCSSFLEV